jgi:hypothetical protein
MMYLLRNIKRFQPSDAVWHHTFHLLLTLLVPPDFGGASEKCQGEF